jgi:hypothetical protein
MHDKTFCLDHGSIALTVGLTERGYTPYLALTYPHFTPPADQGPTLLFYGSDAEDIAGALLAARRESALLRLQLPPTTAEQVRTTKNRLADQLDRREPIDRIQLADLIHLLDALDL